MRHCRHDLYESIEALNSAAKDASKALFADGNPLRAGLKLHAWKITLENPRTQQPISFCAPPASHFTGIMEQTGLKLPDNSKVKT